MAGSNDSAVVEEIIYAMFLKPLKPDGIKLNAVFSPFEGCYRCYHTRNKELARAVIFSILALTSLSVSVWMELLSIWESVEVRPH